jgi:hypothetical protein
MTDNPYPLPAFMEEAFEKKEREECEKKPTVDRAKLYAYLRSKMVWADTTTPMTLIIQSALAGLLHTKIAMGEFDVDTEEKGK